MQKPTPVDTTDKTMPEKYEGVAFPPNYYCRAWNSRRQKFCKQRAGFQTDHPGVGRCKWHGGKAVTKHGMRRRYELTSRKRIDELIAHHSKDDQPLDIFPELAAARALFQDFLERYDANSAALLAWHRSWGASACPLTPPKANALRRVLDEYESECGARAELTESQRADLALAREGVAFLTEPPVAKPYQVLDVADGWRIVDVITKIVERIERIRAGNAMSWPEFEKVMLAMAAVVKLYVKDDAIAEKIQEGWLGLRV